MSKKLLHSHHNTRKCQKSYYIHTKVTKVCPPPDLSVPPASGSIGSLRTYHDPQLGVLGVYRDRMSPIDDKASRTCSSDALARFCVLVPDFPSLKVTNRTCFVPETELTKWFETRLVRESDKSVWFETRIVRESVKTYLSRTRK